MDPALITWLVVAAVVIAVLSFILGRRGGPTTGAGAERQRGVRLLPVRGQ